MKQKDVMITYRIKGPPHWSPLDMREIFSVIADDLHRDEAYKWAHYEKDPIGGTLLVDRELLAEHKANIEVLYRCTLTKENR